MNKTRLKLRCNQTISELRKLGKYTDCGNGSGYTFIDQGGKVLAVAHTDYVIRSDHFIHNGGHKIWSGRLDDRLGVYTLLDYLRGRGLRYDILLTEDEEIGQSTASEFKTDKEYNWMFQFDRRGVQSVMYQYETPELVDMLKSVGAPVGVGSFSDISSLDHLGISGINFATGYHDEHTMTCHMIIPEWKASVERFIQFFSRFENTKLEYTWTPPKRPYWNNGWAGHSTIWDSVWDNDEYEQKLLPRKVYTYPSTDNKPLADDYDICDLCKRTYFDDDNLACIWETNMCQECLSYWDKYFDDHQEDDGICNDCRYPMKYCQCEPETRDG